MMEKCEVNGKNTHPLYAYLRNNSELFDSASGQAKEIPWNFTKFMVDKDGNVLKLIEPKETEEMSKFVD